jgi:hypothetical protein
MNISWIANLNAGSELKLMLNNLRIAHVMIRSKLKYFIEAKAVEIMYLELLSDSNTSQYPWFYVNCR